MNDAYLRRPKEAVLGPVARRAPRAIHPNVVTLAGVIPGIGAAVAAAAGRPAMAVLLWLANRLLDGLDGTLARQQRRQSDLGAYLDIVMDFVVYAAVPIGIAVGAGSTGVWIAAAVLLAVFYVNAISWSFLTALLERRRATTPARLTTLEMPGGLVEGAETVVLFAFMLAMPAWAPALMVVMSGAVAVTAAQRIRWALRNL